ncbi:methyl-accepting chemotaxis protein [Kineosporia succinea]|uniref:Methyl-accepting chemotaxis protein n=1 Tax=Kineosporia succinea TaxID=84632 RepID=A0ABT9P7E4_9ACTN|nr:methyl-accepting chemotaxis protein [Kineosporia succinea]MDP9828619.1 methyl-accepting chemotaxis protein [Kineosporia succinea]
MGHVNVATPMGVPPLMSRLSAWPIRVVFRVLVVATLVALGAIALAATYSHRAQAAAQDRYEATVQAFADIKDMQNTGTGIVSNNAMIAFAPQLAADMTKERTANFATMQGLVDHGQSLDVPDDLKQQIAGVGTAYTNLSAFLEGLTSPRNAAEQQEQAQQIQEQIGVATQAVKTAMDTAQAHQDDVAAGIDSTGRTNSIVTLALCLFTAVLLGGLLLAYGRRIGSAVDELKGAVNRVAEGDLVHPVPVHGKDELAQMARALEDMRLRLVQVFGLLADSSNRLGDSAGTLTGIFTEVGGASEQTSTQMGQVSATANEVSANIQAVAAGSEQMGASIGEIARSAGDAAREATAAVNAVESTTGTMNKLGESSREIGDVIKLITSIAEQTNLLALNATIEAARAGDAGKGFAVVADEVKQLAQETARATEDISTRVETIQTDAVQAGEAIQSVAAVINRINEYQATIASAVEEQSATTQAINAGVNEAAGGSTEIADSIATAARNAAATASSMQRGTDSAAQITSLRQQLNGVISSFRLPA